MEDVTATTEVGAETVSQTAETRDATMEDGAAMTAVVEIDRTCLQTDVVAAATTVMTAMDAEVDATVQIIAIAARIVTI